MPNQKRKRLNPSLLAPLVILGTAFALGFSPVVFNLTMDPYQVFGERNRSTRINDLAEKTHYPLWKLAKYSGGQHSTIILGDSRARSLRDKYWHEAGLKSALNLAYGGGTIPEIYSTFQLIRNDKSIRRLVIGIQLRSFDEDHKRGMNRVPEAVELLSSRFSYLKNWHVTQTSKNMFLAENPSAVEAGLAVLQKMSLEVRANELGPAGATPLPKLLEPKVCFGCDLPENLAAVPWIRNGNISRNRNSEIFRELSNYKIGWFHGESGSRFYTDDFKSLFSRDTKTLPAKHARQVRKNGASDWRGFEVSEAYWQVLEEIGGWAKSNSVDLIFVVPPTVKAMQKTIYLNNLSAENHAMRMRLARLGKVLDFDFPNKITQHAEHFTDAYHFNSRIARAIAIQIAGQFKLPFAVKQRKFKFDLSCPSSRKPAGFRHLFQNIRVLSGKACRLWESTS